MVATLMKWIPWSSSSSSSPSSSKKYEVRITIHQLRGLVGSLQHPEASRFCVEIQWKGSKGSALSSLMSRSLRRNFTREEMLTEDGVVYWDEEFHCVCDFLANKDGGLFHPWEVLLKVHTDLRHVANNNILAGAAASLNLADFTPSSNKKDKEISIHLPIPANCISLHVSVSLREVTTAEERMPKVTISLPRLARSPIRMDIFKGLPGLRARTSHEYSSDGRSSSDSRFSSSHDSDSFDVSDEGGSEDMKEEDSCIRKSFSYGTLAYANHAGASSCSEDEDLIYYSHRRSDGGNIYPAAASVPVVNNPPQGNLKRRLLPWSKRKLASPVLKGEPLLKKYSEEEGGDDIDFDRRQLRSSQESNLISDQRSMESSPAERPSEFGDDNFSVGIWEDREITSRDGQMKLKTQVFFASIDQRSERAAGESACTALVAVIADWFHENHDQITPIKSQLDALISEGSLEWRKLCENESYGERFPDKHFDLETVLAAGIRPLAVVPEKSFIGFFHPEQVVVEEEEEGLDFLQGAMSFDGIWDEIRVSASGIRPAGSPVVYIISWNDHFFILRVENDAYYIIDTLGERLHEGCDQAFVLKFDENTVIHRVGQNPDESDKTVDGSAGKQVSSEAENIDDEPKENIEDERMIVCSGKESCKQYIKSFLAAIPIRELQVDLKKGLMASTPIHHRLQIECHYTARYRNFSLAGGIPT